MWRGRRDHEQRRLRIAHETVRPAEGRVPVRAVILDLDGTLLRADGAVSQTTRNALHQLATTDVWVVAATARAPRGVYSVVPEIPWAVCCNGAIIYDTDRRAITWERTFETDAAIEIVEQVRRAVPDVGFAARCGDQLLCNQRYADERPGTLPSGAALIERGGELVGHSVHALAFRRAGLDATDIHTAATDAFESRGRPTHSTSPILDIAPPGVSKAVALEVLADRQGWSASQAVAFGDMPNDLEVLSWAGLAVAVANGHSDVRAASDLITDTNDNDGVARSLGRLGLLRSDA